MVGACVSPILAEIRIVETLLLQVCPLAVELRFGAFKLCLLLSESGSVLIELGASGTRLVITLLNELRRSGLRHGLATACIGGGQWRDRAAVLCAVVHSTA